MSPRSRRAVYKLALYFRGWPSDDRRQIYSQEYGTPGGVGVYNIYTGTGMASPEPMRETYGVLTVGSASSGTVADGEQVTDATGDVLPYTAIEDDISGSGAGSTWVVNNAQTVASENMTMTGAPLVGNLHCRHRRYCRTRIISRFSRTEILPSTHRH